MNSQIKTVTLRSIALGVLLAIGAAAINCWIAIVYNVQFFGGIQMPFVAVFVLLVFILGVNWPLRALNRRVPFTAKFFSPFSRVELLAIYAMTMFGGMISTPGADNQFLTAGSTLFYFATPENRWAQLFNRHVPSWLMPNRNAGANVVSDLYNGGLTFGQVPWNAWTVMLIGWGVFMLLLYAMLFFVALMLRRQWISNEALAFPLVMLPVQMVEVDAGSTLPPSRAFWGDKLMWTGFALACFLHFFGGMNKIFPDWPVMPVNEFGRVNIAFTERPWNAVGEINIAIFLGAIGIAYLLTREVSFSFWFFFLMVSLEYVVAEMVGFPIAGLEKDKHLGRPVFLTFQSMGGWLAMAVLLLWAARAHLMALLREAFNRKSPVQNSNSDEPFSSRFVVFGFLGSTLGLLIWSWFAGINPIFAFAFLGIYLMMSLVLARLVIEGGFIFPQPTFSAIEWLTTAMFSTKIIGAANLTKLSILSPPLFSDPRTNVLPAFLHTFKIADELRLDHKQLRRLIGAVLLALFVGFVTTMVVSIFALYNHGGLASYKWFARNAYIAVFDGTASTLKQQPGFETTRVMWMGLGAAIVVGLMAARSRFLWFPLHPLGYILATGYPISRLWFSFFLGWGVKTILMKYGGGDAYTRFRPFMIGLIFGNICAMIFWMIVSFLLGNPGAYSHWPA